MEKPPQKATLWISQLRGAQESGGAAPAGGGGGSGGETRGTARAVKKGNTGPGAEGGGGGGGGGEGCRVRRYRVTSQPGVADHQSTVRSMRPRKGPGRRRKL